MRFLTAATNPLERRALMRQRVVPFVLSSALVAGAGWNITSTREHSDRWLQIAQDTLYTIAIDTTRIEREGNHMFTIWYRTDHATTRFYNAKRFDREIVQAVLQCHAFKFRVAGVDMVLRPGRLVVRQRARAGELSQQPWREIEAGSTDAIVAKAACELAGSRIGRT